VRLSRIHRAISFGFLIAAVTLPACTRESQKRETAANIMMELTVDPSPASIGEAMLYFKLFDSQNLPLEGTSLRVKGDMSHPGMQPILADSEEIGNGRYSTPFEWTMGGDWILTITGELPDGQSFSHTFELSISSD